MQFKTYHRGSQISSADLNARAEATYQALRFCDGTIGAEGRSSLPEVLQPTLAKIIGVSFGDVDDNGNLSTSTRPTYSWQIVNEIDTPSNPGILDNTSVSSALFSGTLDWVAYERTNNPNVPVDGSVIVNLYPGLSGQYLVFDSPREFVIARLTGTQTLTSDGLLISGLGYSWYELLPNSGPISSWIQFPVKNGGLQGGINPTQGFTGWIGNGGATVTFTTSSTIINSVTATPVAIGSGYPPNSTFNLNVIGGGGSGGIIQATSDANGSITSFNTTPISGGTGYANTTGANTLGPFNIIVITNAITSDITSQLFVGQLITSSSFEGLIPANTVITNFDITNGLIFLSDDAVTNSNAEDDFVIGGNTGNAFPYRGSPHIIYDNNANYTLSRGFCTGYPNIVLTQVQTADGINPQVVSIIIRRAFSGTWTLIFDGDPNSGSAQVTTPLLFNCVAVDLQTALEGADFTEDVVFSVAGSGTDADPFLVTIGSGLNYPPMIPLYQESLGSDQTWLFETGDCCGLDVVWGPADPQIEDFIEVPGQLYDQNGSAVTSNWTDVFISVTDERRDSTPSKIATIHAAYIPVGIILEGEGTPSVRMRSFNGQYKIKVVTDTAGDYYIWSDQSKNSQEFVKARDDVYQLIFVTNGQSASGSGTITARASVTSSDSPVSGATSGSGTIRAVATVSVGTGGSGQTCFDCVDVTNQLCLFVDHPSSLGGTFILQRLNSQFNAFPPGGVNPCIWGYVVSSSIVATAYGLVHITGPQSISGQFGSISALFPSYVFPTPGWYIFLVETNGTQINFDASWKLPDGWCPGTNGTAINVYDPFVSSVFVSVPPCISLPSVISISPSSGPIAGGTTVTIIGTGFIGATDVKFGTTDATFSVISDTEIIVTSPTESVGIVDVTVATIVGISAESSADLFTYYGAAVPEVTFVDPNTGPITGNTTVTITGNYFTGATSVLFDSTAATSFTVNADIQIVAVSPAHVSGTVDITVTTPIGISGISANDHFAYINSPIITSISPNNGPIAGGTTVTIAGSGFTGVYNVTFGGTVASYTFISDTSVTSISPAHSAGTIDVQITTTVGSSATSSADQFSYGTVPVITSISPNIGPTAGGTTVTIAGTTFTGTSAVNFGVLAAASYIVNSGVQIEAVSPAQSAGTVDITVVNGGITSATSSADQFTFSDGPVVTSINFTVGSVDGGVDRIISGLHFVGATDVKFGSTSVTSFTVVSDTSISVIVPAHIAGTVDVTVITPYGTSVTSLVDKYTYYSAPTITSISPSAGSISGGTVVTIAGTNFITNSGSFFVEFGSTSAIGIISSTTTQLVVVSPAHVAGIVDITILSTAGNSSISTADHFTYLYLYDTFQDVNGTLLSNHVMDVGSGWTVVPVIGSATNGVIVSNKATINTTAETYLRSYADAFSANHTAAIQFTLTTTNECSVAVDCRLLDGINLCQAHVIANTNQLRLSKLVAGVETILNTQTVGTLNTGITYTLKIVSTAITLNATLTGSDISTVTTGNISDSTGAANTKFGFDMYRFDANNFHQINVISFKVDQ